MELGPELPPLLLLLLPLDRGPPLFIERRFGIWGADMVLRLKCGEQVEVEL